MNKRYYEHTLSTTREFIEYLLKNIPVLEGVTAEDFVRSADKNAAKVTPRLSVEAKKRLRKVLEKSRSFRFN